MTCAQALFQYNILSEEQLCSVMDNILPQVWGGLGEGEDTEGREKEKLSVDLFQAVSCLDEDSQSTRLVSCKVVRLLLQQSPQYFTGILTSIVC